MTIVLAHGLFGFGDILPGSLSSLQVVHYFNGVARHLRDRGHTVFEPQVNPIGSIQQRGDRLATEILKNQDLVDPLHIIAHSMGGLDARHAISRHAELAQRVRTLVTIGTPHGGSPVADALDNPTHPLREHVPPFLMQKLEANAGAVHELTVDFCRQFNQNTPDVKGVRYIEVAGDASQADAELPLFQLATAIGRIKNEINDGVVTKASALRQDHEHLADWPVDHAGEIGWSTALLNPVKARSVMEQHLARYDAIVALF